MDVLRKLNLSDEGFGLGRRQEPAEHGDNERAPAHEGRLRHFAAKQTICRGAAAPDRAGNVAEGQIMTIRKIAETIRDLGSDEVPAGRIRTRMNIELFGGEEEDPGKFVAFQLSAANSLANGMGSDPENAGGHLGRIKTKERLLGVRHRSRKFLRCAADIRDRQSAAGDTAIFNFGLFRAGRAEHRNTMQVI